MSSAEERVWARLPEGTREALAALPGTDLQTLLLSVARTRASAVRPADLMWRRRDDRFVRPSTTDPGALAAVEARIWRSLPAEFEGVALSPVAPLGACSAVGPVSQNRVVTTMRGTEVLSDATNALAIEAAHRRRGQPASGEVHLAAHHRLLRAQDFGPGMSAHFPLFTLVSSARDTGSGVTQARLLTLHLGFWQRVLAGLPGARLHYTIMGSPALRPALAALALEEPDRTRGRGYYTEAALRITAGDVELGDGGFTDWTARLMGNAKERCLTSCLSTERLIHVVGHHGA